MQERTARLLVLAFGATMFLPNLGSVGLWDPWETHYAEVAREMIARDDYVHPHWMNAYFFSKPILTLHLIALGLVAVRAEPGIAGAPLGEWVEWGVRLPFGLLAILTLWAVYRIGRELADPETGAIAAFVLGTSPQFVFIGKQAITDLPLVALTMAGLAFLIPAVFPKVAPREPAPRMPWIPWIPWIAAAFFATIAAIQIVLVRDPIWPLELLLVAAIAVVIVRSKRFAEIAIASTFFGLAALAKGLEVGALLAPAFLGTVLVTRDWGAFRRAQLPLAFAIFFLIAAPWYVEMLRFSGRDDEGLTFAARFFGHDHFARVASGVHGDRAGAGYFAEQILYGFFPWSAILPLIILSLRNFRKPALLFWLIYAAWIYALFTISQTKLHHYCFPIIPALALLIAFARPRMNTALLLLALTIYGVALRDFLVEPRHLVNLFTYKYDRDYPSEVIVRPFLIAIAGGGGLLALGFALAQKKRAAVLTFASTALCFALWLSHHHFNMLARHWSQAYLFRTYHEEREPGDTLLAYNLMWRGENFYSRNEVIEVMGAGANTRLRQLVDGPGKAFIITETDRYQTLKSVIPEIEIVDRSNVNFYLCKER